MNSVEHRSASISFPQFIVSFAHLFCNLRASPLGELLGLPQTEVFDLTCAPPDPLLHLRSSAVWAELSGESVMDGTPRRAAFSASCLTEPRFPCD